MKPIDWIVMFAWLVAIVGYGLYRGRGSNTVDRYLLAGKSMPWYAMGLSIMATQASAVTFISTTGQSYTDGMRFVQFYFGLPLAMVILSATAVPIFHRANVYTAYEYLEQRFDVKMRALVSAIFLIQRGLAAGLSLYAPSVVLSVILGWPDRWTTVLMGVLVVTYTSIGGNKAVIWADVQQMLLISCALVLALFMAVHLLPGDVSWTKAVSLAGAAGRLNAVTTHFDWDDRFNLWSGLIGGMFLALAYFGCDQSQVQRYLTGKSIAQSRLSLLFNALAKIPMQFFILFIGAMVFVFFTFEKPPLLFQPVELARVAKDPRFAAVEQRYDQAFAERKQAAEAYLQARDPQAQQDTRSRYQAAQRDLTEAHAAGEQLAGKDFRRHQLHLPLVRHSLFAGGRCGADHRGDLHGGDVVDFGRDQFPCRRYDHRPVPETRSEGRVRSSLFDGVATGHGVLGRLRRGLRTIRQEFRRADCGGQCRWVAFLWRPAGCVRAGVRFFKKVGAQRSVPRRPGGRGRDLRRLPVHEDLLPLVQRDWVRRGDRGRPAGISVFVRHSAEALA